ncbi:MAG: EAL domain-containing protein [Fusobacteriaceae bacterium]|nr:EAL domain-containing protein [Fusobacteriaceae bacterium]
MKNYMYNRFIKRSDKRNLVLSFIQKNSEAFWHWDIINNIYNIDSNNSIFSNFENKTLECWKEIVHPEDLDMALKTLNSFLKGDSDNYINCYRIFNEKVDEYIWIESKGFAKILNKKIVCMYGVHKNINEKIEIDKKLNMLAYYDKLTGIFNYEKLNIEYEFKKSLEPSKEDAIIVFSIDNYSQIYNTLNLNLSNRIIKTFVNFLKIEFGYKNIARKAENEFIAIYTLDQSIADLNNKIRDFYKKFSKINFLKMNSIYIPVSIGISVSKSKFNMLQDLVKQAEIALFHSKKRSNNSYKIYNFLMEKEIENYTLMMNKLKIAIEENEFELFYQPILNIKNNVVGVEALIRWHSSSQGMVYPMQFISIAEESSQIIEIEKIILENAFCQLKKWEKTKFSHLLMSINLSPKGMINTNLNLYLEKLQKKYSVLTNRIEFEITESFLMENFNKTLKMIKSLQALGYRISLDDFGTGYSSLSYLKDLPINKLKLDKSFIDNICIVEKDKTILEAIIKLCHNLGFGVVAEGVEECRQLDLLNALQCDFLQGYLFSKPQKIDEFEKWFLEYEEAII